MLRNDMANIKSETHLLSEYNKFIKEDSTNFSSKLDDHVNKLTFFTTSFYGGVEKTSVKFYQAEKFKQQHHTSNQQFK